MSDNASVTQSSERFTGRVKWFNNKAGYGFVTVTDGVKTGSDIFVHHSSIKVDSEQYKYLVQGEYVDFTLTPTTNANSNHEFQAVEVCGVKGGKLMCETRRDLRVARSQYRTTKSDEEENAEPVRMPTSVRAPRVRGSGPRDNSEWSYVNKARRNLQQEDNLDASAGPKKPVSKSVRTKK
jgi:CspA family cold shock protein